MNEWNIQSRGHACEACGALPIRKLITRFCLTRKLHLPWSDICVSCWRRRSIGGISRERKGFVSHWQGNLRSAGDGAGADPQGHGGIAVAEIDRAERSEHIPAGLHPGRDAGAKTAAQGEGTIGCATAGGETSTASQNRGASSRSGSGVAVESGCCQCNMTWRHYLSTD